MASLPPLPPPGWYNDPDDPSVTRWWDGSTWTEAKNALPAPAQPTVKPDNDSATTSLVIGITFLVIFPLGFIGILGVLFGVLGMVTAARHRKAQASPTGSARAWWGLVLSLAAVVSASIFYSSLPDMPDSSEVSNESAQSSAPPQKSAAEQFDDAMEADGYTVVDSGENYFRWLNEEEKANSSCGYVACTFGVIYSKNGCSSFYVKADLISGGTPVGWTNEMTASARPDEAITFELNDHQGIADSYRISEIRCMG